MKNFVIKDFSRPLVHNPEDLLPFVLLRQDTAKAIDDYRIEAVKNMVPTFHGSGWRMYITDRCVGKKVKPESYASNEEEAEELSQLDAMLDSFDTLKNKVEVALAGDKPVETLDSVLVGYDAEKLLVAIQPMYDADFCRHIQKLNEEGHFIADLGGTRLRNVFLKYFDHVPSISSFNKAFRGEYGANEVKRPREFTPRKRIDK